MFECKATSNACAMCLELGLMFSLMDTTNNYVRSGILRAFCFRYHSVSSSSLISSSSSLWGDGTNGIEPNVGVQNG